VERIVAHRDRRRCRIVRRRRTAALACALILAGCSDRPERTERTERRVAVVPTRSAPAISTRPATPTKPLASPSPTPAPPRRAFVAPPLPTELVDPPGLVPLPPRPTFADNHQGEMP